MKKFTQKVLGIIALGAFAGGVNALPVTVTYTADNVTEFAIACVIPTGPSSCGAGTSFALGANYNDWTKSDTANLDLAEGQYWFSFKVRNLGGPSTGNPGAFLAEIGGATWGDTLTSSAWQVDVERPTLFPSVSDVWVSATEYGANNGTTIWQNNSGTISGISDDAQWIWDSTNYEGEEFIAVRGLINVPEPSIIALFGLGLAGLGFAARRRKV